MALTSQNGSVTKLARICFSTLLVLAMAACGGGGGSPGTTSGTGSGGSTGGTGTSTDGTVTVTLTDTVGTAKNTLSGGNPLVAKATVKDASGTKVKDAVVTFTVGSSIAVLSPSGGTALTDSEGVATVGLEASVGTGASEITASAVTSSGGTAVTGKATFSVGAAVSATPAAINFVKATPTDKSIVLKGSGGNGRTEVALLTFKVVDSSNAGVANKAVTFSLAIPSSVSSGPTLVSTTGTTNQNGEVTATINSGSSPTTARVVATVTGSGATISALSDTVTVTTGIPIQGAFSPSVETFNISGWNHDNVKTKVNILMADAFGNPVADGTPVVFQTDSGAIGSADGGRCLTVNGECSVDFRSQNPRLSTGIATITISSTDGTNELTGSVRIILSGDAPRVYVGGVAQSTSVVNALATTVCTDYRLLIDVKDARGNPLPSGTTVAVGNLTDVTVSAVTPATVPNQLGYSSHSIPVKPDATKCAAPAAGHKGTFDLIITPPLGSAVSYPFSLTFP